MFDRSDTVRAVQNAEIESKSLLKQFHIWLVIGASGGAVTMFTLAVGSNNPDHILKFFQWSLWSFLLSTVFSSTSVLLLSFKLSSFAEYLASASNRDSLDDAIRKIPEIISSPQRIADEGNIERDWLKDQRESEDKEADSAYRKFEIYKFLWAFFLIISGIFFVIGFSAPLLQITFLDHSMISAVSE